MSFMILILILSISYLNITCQYIERELCIPKCLCLPSEHFMSCHENSNMLMIPKYIHKSITRFIVQKGYFDIPILDKRNLSGLEHIIFLKIIYYNLHTINPKAFINMKKLTYLDLSYNKLIIVGTFAFRGLHLVEFHIMNNENIHFKNNAFYEMTSLSINMRNNNLLEINYDMFKNTKVKYFYLYNNKITTINKKFETLFNNSDSLLDLSNNPLICDCSLDWLARILSIQYSNKTSLIHSKNINISCNKPLDLRYKQLRFLKAEDLKCSPLRIEKVMLHFDGDTTKVTCVSKVGGNKSPLVKWLHYINEVENDIMKSSKIVKESQSNILKSYSVTYNTINLTGNLFKDGICKLVCLASISNDFIHRLEIHIHKINTSSIQYFSNRTNIEFLIPKETNFLFIKHFSILEMLGAILGTFCVTFGSLLILLRSYQNKLMNSKDYADLHKNINSIKPYRYVPHGNISTYSLPHNHQQDEYPNTFDNMENCRNAYPFTSINKLKFLDYKTQNVIVQ